MAEIKAKLIDVSAHQGTIDWEKVKPHIDGAILRVGFGMDQEDQDDGQFKRNADECTRLGIPFGVYLYSYADSMERIKSEADHVLRLVKGYKLSYPVYLDLEENGTQSGAIERAKVFGNLIEGAGYWCGIYANTSWWNNHLKGLDCYTKWVAQYYTECQYKGSHLDIWQYSSKGKVPGISGNVDMNYCYRDFPAEILGGEPTTEQPVSKAEEKSTEKNDPAASFNKAKAGTYMVTANGLNLRRGASTEKAIIEVLPKGKKVTCYGYYTGEWLYVKTSGGSTGFCHSSYLAWG